MEKVRAAVLGATGIVGQVFMWMLSDHPWFDPVFIAATSGRRGKRYGDEVRWLLPFPMPEVIKNKRLEILNLSNLSKTDTPLVFSGLPSDVAKTVEPELRKEGFWVFSNASAMRYDSDVPIAIPEVNLESIHLIKKQGFPQKGFVITNANCSTTGLAVALAPLKKFGIEEVTVSTYQSISGAGYPGLPALDIGGNAIPYIQDEEKKMRIELQKILEIKAEIYPYCVRIPTLFGHLESVWVRFKKSVEPVDVVDAWKNFRLKSVDIPSMPDKIVDYSDADDFPQSRITFWGTPPGMTVYTGRLKKESGKIGFVLLVNNLVKGGAGGSIENAEAFLSLYKK